MPGAPLRALVLGVLVAACNGVPVDPAPPDAGMPLAYVTLDELVREMADLDHLARVPELSDYRTLQSSSWDRRSSDPSDPSEIDGWFANDDKAQFEAAVEVDGRRELVMLEAEGAGAIVRIWSAQPLGTIRIYIDDFTRPAIEARMEDLLGPSDPVFGAPFGYVRARGANLYFPISFSRRVRVTTDEGELDPALYYHVNYRIYADGIHVEPYSDEALASAAASVAEARDALVDPDSIVRGAPQTLTVPATIAAPGPGGGVIRRLEVRAPGATEEDLRGSVLVVSFDGDETIRAPLGDFFGTGPGANALSTLALSATEDGTFVSRFPMPFATDATIDVEGPLDPSVQVVVDAWDFDDRSQHFHAGWGSTGLVESQPKRDLGVAHIRGAGTYVGTHLVVANPVDEWWGEGDEKIYVDGDPFPTWFGTGTEDYFGYAYTDLSLFSAPYHAQTRTGITSQAGHISNLRVHVIDPIRFESSIDFDLELWAWVPSEIAMHWVAYWYARGSEDDFSPLAAGDALVFDPTTFRR